MLSAPSGTGKTTLCSKLLKAVPGLVRSVSVTTRRPRRGERKGKDYLFIPAEVFRRLRRAGGLLEWTNYSRFFYGTPLDSLKRFLAEGKKVVLLLDVRGARAVKQRFRTRTTTIFLLPPTLGDLKKRLARRSTEENAEIQRRLRLAKHEITQARWYDHVVVNDDIRQALRALQQIIRRKG